MHALQGWIGRCVSLMYNETSVMLVMYLCNSSKGARHAVFVRSVPLI